MKFNLVLASGRSTIELVGKVGESIEDVAKRNGHVEGACDGNCQCSTCHIFIPKESDRVSLRKEKENVPIAFALDFDVQVSLLLFVRLLTSTQTQTGPHAHVSVRSLAAVHTRALARTHTHRRGC